MEWRLLVVKHLHLIRELSNELPNEDLRRIESIRDALIAVSSQKLACDPWITDHSVRHCDEVLGGALAVLKEQRQLLNPHELLILAVACYLHDIGFFFPKVAEDDTSLKTLYSDIRAQHSRYSEAIVLDKQLQENLGLDLQVTSREGMYLVARLCRLHDNSDNLKLLSSKENVNAQEVRSRLLGALLILGDSLDVGVRRITTENLTLVPLTLRSRKFWYSLSCIVSAEVREASLIIALAKSGELTDQTFETTVFTPVGIHFQNLLNTLNPTFTEAGFTPLQLVLQIEPSVRRGENDATASILATNLIENEIRQRNANRKEAIEKKLTKEGLVSKRLVENELIILRRWSSYTPRMPTWQNLTGVAIPGPWQSRGGGYFLVWKQTGIAIDPGYDFLRNFWEEKVGGHGFELSDISAVLVSHAHDDHCHDVEPLISLNHKRKKITGHEPCVHFYMSEGTHIKYERLFSVNDYMKVVDLVPGASVARLGSSGKFLADRGVEVEFLRTIHNELPWIRNHTGVALRMRLTDQNDKLTVGYTSDTRYFPELVNFFSDVDLLILHLGNMGPHGADTEPYDKNHLGLNGCHDLIANLVKSKVHLFLLGEFGEEEVGNDRIRLCQLLTQDCALGNFNKALLPMDIGMRIKLPSLSIVCQENGHNQHLVPCNQIFPHLAGDSIVYYCQ